MPYSETERMLGYQKFISENPNPAPEEVWIAALLFIQAWYGPDNYDMEDLVTYIDTEIGE